MAKRLLTTLAVDRQTAAKLNRIKKVTGLSLGRLTDIGIAFLEPKILSGELVAQNGRLVVAATPLQPQEATR